MYLFKSVNHLVRYLQYVYSPIAATGFRYDEVYSQSPSPQHAG